MVLRTCGMEELWTSGIADFEDLRNCGVAEMCSCGIAESWTCGIADYEVDSLQEQHFPYTTL